MITIIKRAESFQLFLHHSISTQSVMLIWMY